MLLNLPTRGSVWLSVLLIALLTAGAAAQKPKPPVKPKTPPPPKAAAPVPKARAPEAPKPQQWKVVSRYVADGVETLTTVYAGARRQRVDLPGGTALITQCDLSRTVQLNTRARAYAIVPFATAAASPSQPSKPGATVTSHTIGTDTGERKELFGLQARHLKLVTTTEPSPQACDKKKGRVETDGWFADVPELQECEGARSQRAAAEPAGTCRDQRVDDKSGIEVSGFPLAYSVTAFDGAGKEVSKLVVEVTALSREPLDQHLFEPPSDFTSLPDTDALLAVARRAELEELGTTPKSAGIIRIGVPLPVDKSGKGGGGDTLRGVLLENFSARPFEAIPLSATAADEQQTRRARRNAITSCARSSAR